MYNEETASLKDQPPIICALFICSEGVCLNDVCLSWTRNHSSRIDWSRASYFRAGNYQHWLDNHWFWFVARRLIWGLNSHQVSYIAGNQGIYVVSAYDGVSTFRQQETGDLYVIQDNDFQPGLAGAFDSSTYAVPRDVHFLASSDLVFVGWGVGFAHPIEKVTFDGATAISAEYQLHPHGYTVNNWPYASLLMLAGMLCLGLSVGLLARTRKQQKRATAAKLATLAALPSPFARELGEEATQPDEEEQNSATRFSGDLLQRVWAGKQCR